MDTSTCSFCSHVNPPRAKFCNECASPLHLKPCRRCNAVNARDAQACYRCGAALQAALATSDTSPERIVAEADETLAALKRELAATTAPDTGASKDGRAGERIANPSARLDVRAADRLSSSSGEAVAADLASAVIDETGNRAAPATPAAQPTFDATSADVRPEERQWRPERRSRGFALAVAIALVVLPFAVYVMRNPAQLDEWLGRTGAAPTIEPATADALPAAAPAAAPIEPLATPATSSDPAAVQSDSASVAQPVTQPGARDETLLPSSPPADLPAQEDAESVVVGTPASVAPTSDRDAKPAPPSRARSSAARARPRERVTKPRPLAPHAQSQRGSAQPAVPDQTSPAEPCSEAVAALGLCIR